MRKIEKYIVGDTVYTMKEMMAMTGLSKGGMALRMRNYEAGKITAEQALGGRCQGVPFNGIKDSAARGEWGGLSGRVRNENMAGIPGPSPFERGL